MVAPMVCENGIFGTSNTILQTTN
eukprot:COSAG06_NODE_25588_length_633_cov_1.132959_1_plen_23_part_10